jgi:hypothetical protein
LIFYAVPNQSLSNHWSNHWSAHDHVPNQWLVSACGVHRICWSMHSCVSTLRDYRCLPLPIII